MTIVVYISGHGLGHASRMIEVLNAAAALRPGTRFIVRTRAARWIFHENLRGPVDVQDCEADVGVIQVHSLEQDEGETARRAAAFYAGFDARVRDEAARLRAERADLVVGDIPPLAFAAAAAAGLPSLAIGNFTWDWIYEAFPAFATAAPEVLPRIREAYRAATTALRLPFHGGFSPMAGHIRDIPLVARRSTRDPGDTREALGIVGGAPVVLASFGAYGAPVSYADAVRGGRLTVVTADPDLCEAADRPAGLVCLALPAVRARGMRYEDLVAAADVVVSKPGYGIVSECIANGAALLYASRGHFREEDIFLDEMPRRLRTRQIARDDLLAGRWAEAVEALLAQPEPAERLAVNGAPVAAEAILSAPARP
jgi:hypothetical protein